jgi:hypothetical protein
MNIRPLIASACAAVLLAPAAFAGEGKAADCAKLQAEFDKQATTAQASQADAARALRDEGAKLCAEGKGDEGAKKLQEAISALGQAPATS